MGGEIAPRGYAGTSRKEYSSGTPAAGGTPRNKAKGGKEGPQAGMLGNGPDSHPGREGEFAALRGVPPDKRARGKARWLTAFRDKGFVAAL
jgi:hypothetical protein